MVYLDTRANSDVVLLKLANLQNSLNTFASVISPTLFSQLQSRIAQIALLIGSGGSDADRPGAILLLRDLKGFVRLNSGEGIRNFPGIDGSGNASGGLISFADTLIFQLTL